MKTKILFVLFAIFALTSCHCVSPDADEESVLIYKPWFFGHGGIDEDPVQTGLTWCWWSTHSETFKISQFVMMKPLMIFSAMIIHL